MIPSIYFKLLIYVYYYGINIKGGKVDTIDNVTWQKIIQPCKLDLSTHLS